MPKTDASLGPLTSRRRRAQDRKAKAKTTRQEKELQSARDTKKARSKLAKGRTQKGVNHAWMQFVSETGAIWYIMHDAQQPGFTVGTTGEDGEWAEYFTPTIDVKYAQPTSMLFGPASVYVWPDGSKAKREIKCHIHNACRVEKFLTDCKCAPSGQQAA